ncbi:MAG: type VI secretion system tube protein Hcp [Bacteroidota bacterium]|nr:type VI secretion system tube protein Hcp [Bacteroidota bacterium]
MASNSYLNLAGQKQGSIKGGVTQKGREGNILVMAFHHEITSPIDTASGLATGKRMHKPFVITKEIDRSSPLLYSVLVTNENLTTWELSCFGAKPNGAEIKTYTVTLNNARIVDITSTMLNNRIGDNAKLPLMEDVSFAYQKITWTWIDGNIQSSDDWESPVV